MSHLQVVRRGYLYCSASCVCEGCIYSDDWFLILLDYGLPLFREGPGEIPAPSEFRGAGLDQAA